MQVQSVSSGTNYTSLRQNKNLSKINFGHFPIVETVATAGSLASFVVFAKRYLHKLETYTLFVPNKRDFKNIPESIQGIIKNVETLTEDGLKLKHHYIPAKEGKKTVIFCHGIKHNATTFFEVAKSLHENGYGAFMMEYRGFGHNKGTPSENGLAKDFDSVTEYLNKHGIKDKDIVVWGFSLGGGVASNAATSNRFGGLILNSTFTDVRRAIKENLNNIKNKFVRSLFEKIPVEILPVKSRFDNVSKIPEIKMPVLIMHAKDDHRIPFKMFTELVKKKPDAKIHSVEKGGHTPCFEWTGKAVLDFLSGLQQT